MSNKSTIQIEKLNKKRSLPSPKTQIVLLGLTPGKQQHQAINSSKKPREGAFKGYMRKQMHEWFKELGLAKDFELESEDDLFTRKEFLKTLYMTSLLREPVYIVKEDGVKRNYTGRSPLPWKNEKLKGLMMETLSALEKMKQTTLIIPMGQIVSEAIQNHSSLDEKHFVLHGFPHPSGANANRKNEFEANKRKLKSIYKNFSREI